jgi:hypothetical protein
MKDDESELRFLKSSRNGMDLDPVVTSGMQEKIRAACLRELEFVEPGHAIWWTIEYGARNEALLQITPYSSSLDINALPRSDMYRLIKDSEALGLFAIVRTDGKDIVLEGVFSGSELMSNVDDPHNVYEGNGPRPVRWSDLFHDGFGEGRLFSHVYAAETTAIFVTDFSSGLISRFELMAPVSTVRLLQGARQTGMKSAE